MFKRILLVLIPLGLFFGGVLAFWLTETRNLTGMVRDADTHTPIADAVIDLAGTRVTTNPQGRYNMSIPRSRVMLVASADGYESLQTELNGEDLFQKSFAIDFALSPNRVQATVRDAENSKPLPNVTVRVGDKPVNTDAQGKLALRGVKTQTAIAVEIPGYQPVVFAFAGDVEFEISIVPTQVVVSVLDRYTNQPIPNAQLELPEGKFKSDAQGRVVVKRLKPGTTIRASAAGFETAGVSFSGSDLAIALRPNTLDGTVLDASTSQPISGTLIYLGNTIVATNAKGTYHLDEVPAKATLIFKAPGYRKTQVQINGTAKQDVKLAPFAARGIHIPFGLPIERVRELIELAGKTELNAMVISVKAEKGRVEWDSQVPLAREIGAPFLQGTDLNLVIELCRAKNIYCIARMPVFQDSLLATTRPNYAIKSPNGAVFMENGGTAWVSAYNTDVWSYNIALAKEIAAMGFDEIQWDYVRFPGQANVFLGPGNSEEARIAAVNGFLARAQKELRSTSVFISADVFGLTTATDDEQFIGQRLRDLGPYVDYVSPMVYPDTWNEASDLITRGLGVKNCTVAVNCPYDIIFNSYKRAAEKTATKVRLWLQGYSGRGDFGVKEFRLQKKAVLDAGSSSWLFWNGAGVYDPKIFDPPQ